MQHLLKTKTFIVVCILAVLMGLYAIAGFVIAPKLVRSALLKDIPETIGATPTVGEIHINPFLFQVTVTDFSLAGAGGEKLIGFQRLFVDFDLSSIWHRAYSFGVIDLDSPYVGASVAQDGALNLLQLQPKATTPKPPPKPSDKEEALPALRIGSFKVTQGLVTYEDHSHPDVFAARLEPINFELREFTTGVAGGQFTLTGASKLGERIEWHGHVSVQPLESDGEFHIDGLQVHTLWEYLEDKLNFVVNSGRIDLAATYKFKAAPPDSNGPPSVNVDVSKVSLTDLTVRPKDADADWITVPSLAVTGTSVDLAKRQAHVEEVALTGIKLLAWLEQDGSVNLMKLAAAPTTPGGVPKSGAPAPVLATATTPAATNSSAGATGAAPATAAGTPATAAVAPTVTVAPAVKAAPTVVANTAAAAVGAPPVPWQYDVHAFVLRDASLSVEDRSVHPAVKVLLAPFGVQVSGISQDLSKPLTVTLDTHINQGGSLSVSGEVVPQPATANLSLKLADLDLAPIQPYIGQHTAMTLLTGKMGTEGKVHYGVQKGMPSIQFTGDVHVDKLHTVDNVLQDDFVNWERLDVLGVNFSQGPGRLDIGQIVINKPYARVIIESDESINAKRVLAGPGTAPGSTASTAAASTANSTATANSASTASTSAARAASGSGKTAKTAKTAKVASTPTPAAGAGMPMSVKKIVVQAGQANFSDFSVQPNFTAAIQSLEGSITGLSSQSGSRAKMDLHGEVGPYSPVTVSGEFNVLGPKLYTDIAMGFHNMELTVFNPYSGKFAGYSISKGKLSTDFHYKIDGRKLDAQHHIVVEELEFGDKTASKDAVSLPIKLAVALLKDRNGVIDLNVPVTGSLDDPQFRLAPIIWKVFVNILEKAVTSPFALLGSLFGDKPDIQFIDFPPGVATMDAAANDKVTTVEKALMERPQLKIEVPIGVVPEVDRPALAEARFNAETATAQAARGGSKAGGAGAPFNQLDAATQLDLLTQIYTKDLGSSPKYPDAVTGLKSKPDMIAAKVDFLGKAIREHIQIGDSDLQALGQQRAAAVQQVLLADPQVAAERVFLVANDKAVAKDGSVRLELSLQ